MKKILFLLTLLLTPLVYAQELDAPDSALEQETDSLSLEYQAKQNMVKLSLTSFAFRNLHLQYERVINKKYRLLFRLVEFSKEAYPLSVL